MEEVIKYKIKCDKCGHEWESRSRLVYVTCPSCLGKVKQEEKHL